VKHLGVLAGAGFSDSRGVLESQELLRLALKHG